MAVRAAKEKYKNLDTISKTDRDLLIIAQIGVVNYEQLWLTGFHGKSKEAYRVAVKDLKERGLVETFFFQDRNIAIMLTSKGKEYVRDAFESSLLNQIARQLGKTSPSRTSPQFLHRINTNTFYCCYLSAEKGGITSWNLEYPYEKQRTAYGEGANRSDGYMETKGGMKYFIEQDNYTQRCTAINEKINQYIEAGIFSSSHELEKNMLVFCVDARISEQKRRELQKRDSMQLYQISLKILKLWHLLEHIRDDSLYLRDILAVMEKKSDKIAIECLFTDKECEKAIRLLSGIKELKDADIAAFEWFKDNCRKTGRDDQEKKQALCAAFEKRYKNLYLSLLSIPENEALRDRLKKGMCVYLLPLHDIKTQQPHLLIKEFRMEEEYLKCLACMGLNISDRNLKFSFLYKLRNGKEEIWFRNAFIWPQVLAIWEDISADIGGYYRVSRFLKLGGSLETQIPLLFVLLVRNEKEAVDFYETFETEISQTRKGKIVVTFLSKDKLFFENLMLSPYGIRKRNGKLEWKAVFLEMEQGKLQEFWEDEP